MCVLATITLAHVQSSGEIGLVATSRISCSGGFGEPAVAPDRAGIPVFQGSTSHRPPRQVNGIVSRYGEGRGPRADGRILYGSRIGLRRSATWNAHRPPSL